MDERKFGVVLSKLDAAAAKSFSDNHVKARREAQEIIESLVRDEELSNSQLKCLEGLTFRTAGEPYRITVLRPDMGNNVMSEMLSKVNDEGKFYLNLIGVGQYKVKGPASSRYLPVALERPKTTDKK